MGSRAIGGLEAPGTGTVRSTNTNNKAPGGAGGGKRRPPFFFGQPAVDVSRTTTSELNALADLVVGSLAGGSIAIDIPPAPCQRTQRRAQGEAPRWAGVFWRFPPLFPAYYHAPAPLGGS